MRQGGWRVPGSARCTMYENSSCGSSNRCIEERVGRRNWQDVYVHILKINGNIQSKLQKNEKTD